MALTPVMELRLSSERPPRKRFTRTEVARLRDSGVFDGQRYELIDGDLLDKMGQKPQHSFAIQLLMRWLATFLESAQIRVQLPIEIPGQAGESSEPEPDIAVLFELRRDYQTRHPRGDELMLVIEVADTSLSFDLSRKADLYANAGVPEYWVLDLTRRCLVGHRHPSNDLYQDIHLYSQDDGISIAGRSEKVRISDLLPDAPVQ